MKPNRNARQDWEAERSFTQCNRCGCDVQWRQNKVGKWYMKDVVVERKNGHCEVFESRSPYHVCRGSLDEQIATKRAAVEQLSKELAEYVPDWFDNTETLLTALEENKRALAELEAQKVAA